MKRILVTGATGFVGRNLVNYLLKRKYKVRVFVRDKKKFHIKHQGVEVYTGDLTNYKSLLLALKGIDSAYYLVHSMSETSQLGKIEGLCAKNFAQACSQNKVKRIIYLGGIINPLHEVSRHLKSRKLVGNILRTSKSKVTELRAAVIIGKGGASYTMIQLLIERSPVLILPSQERMLCQPISLEDVLYYLEGCLRMRETIGGIYDIGGATILSYGDLLRVYGRVIKKRRITITIPFFFPVIFSFLISIVTRQRYALVRNLLESIRSETVCQETHIRTILPKQLLSYKDAIRKTF